MPIYLIRTKKFHPMGGSTGMFSRLGDTNPSLSYRELRVGHQSYFFHNDYLVETPLVSMLTLGWIIQNLVDAERWIIRGAHWEFVVVWELTEGEKITVDTPISLWNCRYKEFENAEFSLQIDGGRRIAAHRGTDGFPIKTEIGGDYKTRYLIATSRFGWNQYSPYRHPFLLFQAHQERAVGPGLRHAYRFALGTQDYDRRADGSIMLKKNGPLISRDFFLFQESMWNIKDFWAGYKFDKAGILRQALKPRGEFFPLCVTDNKSARKKNDVVALGKIAADDKIYIILANYATYLNRVARMVRAWHHNLSFETITPSIFMGTIQMLGSFIRFLHDIDPLSFTDIEVPLDYVSHLFYHEGNKYTLGSNPQDVREIMRRLIDTYWYLIDNAPRPYYKDYNYHTVAISTRFWYVDSEIISVSAYDGPAIREMARGENQNSWWSEKFHPWLDRAFSVLDEMARAMETMTVKSTAGVILTRRGYSGERGALRQSRKLQKRTILNAGFARTFTGDGEMFDPFNIATGNNDVSLKDIIRVLPPDETRAVFFWGLIGFERRAVTLYQPPPEPEPAPFSPVIAVTPRPPRPRWDNTIHPNDDDPVRLQNGFHQINPNLETRAQQLQEIHDYLCGGPSTEQKAALWDQFTLQQKATVSFIEQFHPDPCGDFGGDSGGGGASDTW
jgi:hypothetical protein